MWREVCATPQSLVRVLSHRVPRRSAEGARALLELPTSRPPVVGENQKMIVAGTNCGSGLLELSRILARGRSP